MQTTIKPDIILKIKAEKNNRFNKVISLNEVLNNIKNQPSSLLLGNGFSISYNRHAFSYNAIYQKMKTSFSNAPELINLFEKFQTVDFELMISNLSIAKNILSEYSFDARSINLLEQEIKKVRESFLTSLIDLHPKIKDGKNELPIKKDSLQSFFSTFSTIYTLNYDLILYWMLIHYCGTDKISDGFAKIDGRLVFSENFKQNRIKFLFLHGALHLFDINGQTVKISNSSENKTYELIEQSIKDGASPSIVFEAYTEEKKKYIDQSLYLQFAYNSLKSNKNEAMVVFGTVLKDNDRHILEAILSSDVKEIYMGIFDGDYPSSTTENLIRNSGIKLAYYDSRQVDFW